MQNTGFIFMGIIEFYFIFNIIYYRVIMLVIIDENLYKR